MFVNIVIYLIALLGIWLVTKEDITVIFRRCILKRRLGRRNENSGFARIIKRCELLVEASLGFRNCGGVFLAVTFSLTAAVFVAFICSTVFTVAIAAAVMAGLLPLLILKVLLFSKRNEASKEGEAFTAMLLAKYRICSCHMDTALELLIAERDNMKIKEFRQLCEKVLQNIRQAKTGEEVRKAGKPIAYGVGTGWADMIAELIGMAVYEGSEVSKGLEDILMQLREARNLNEERSRLNSESWRLVLYMVPATYLGTVWFSISHLGISFSEVAANQFATEPGIMLFFGIVFTFVFNLMLLAMVQHMRFDN